jgi:K+-H+ exchange-related protein
MRLFLLPISARRSFIYCDRAFVNKHGVKEAATVKEATGKAQSLLDRATAKAAGLWTQWERADGGWQKTLTTYGNALLRRIPYEEWGLKSFPPLTASLRGAYESGKKPGRISLIFPGTFLPEKTVGQVLTKLAKERQDLHRTRMIGSLIGAPLSLPFALIPV